MFKIVLFDVRILALSIILAVLNVLIYGQDETILFSILLGALFFVFIWVFWIALNVFINLTTRIDKVENEKRKLVELSSLLKQDDERNQNGLLLLTNYKLHFKSYFYKREKESLALNFKEIKKVTIKYQGFIERYQMEVETRPNTSWLFNIYAGKRWQKAFKAQNVRVEVTKK